MTVIDVCPHCDGDMEDGQVCRTCYPPSVPELRCAAPDCPREWPAFQVWSRPLEATARTYGWVITDDGRAYCPRCADHGAARVLAAMEVAS